MNSSDRDIESKVRDSSFSNPSHKERLRSRLLEQSQRLGADDLDGVTGGMTVPPSDYKDWDWNSWTWEPWHWNSPEIDPSPTKKGSVFPGTIEDRKKP